MGLAACVGSYLRFALRTTRWTVDGAAHLAPYVPSRPVVVAFWHDRLPLMPALWAEVRRQNPSRHAAMLVSRHRDGRFIGLALSRLGLDIVHGSAARPDRPGRDKGGASSLRALLATLAHGDAVVITPDGPRGPSRVAAGGVAQLAALAAAAVLPVSAQVNRIFRLPSWDRMGIPLPFGRGVIVCLSPIEVTRDGGATALPAIAAALSAAADRADELCRA